MKPLKKLNINTSVMVFADQIIYSGSNFVLAFLLARSLSIYDFGVFSYIILGTYLLLSISNAMIIQPFQIVISKTKVQEAMGFILQAITVVLLIFAILFTLVFFMFSETDLLNFVGRFPSNFKKYFGVSLLFVLGYLYQDFFRKSLLALQRVRWVLLIDLLFLLVFPILLFGKISLNFALLSIGSFNVISAIPGLFYFLRKSSFKNTNYYLTYHIENGKWLLSTAILQWLSSNFLVFVSGIYLGVQAIGALRLVQSFFGILNVILQSVENFFLPKTATLYHQNKREAQKYLSSLTRKGIIIFGIVLLLVFIFSQPIIVLLGGEKYREFGYVIKMMSILYLFIFYSYPLRISVRIQELNKIFFFGYFISFCITILSFHFLLKYTALYGVIIGLIISQMVMIIYWKKKLTNTPFL